MARHMLDFLADHGLGVLATCGSGGEPHSSLMSYVSGQDGRVLYMLSLANTRKWLNIKNNHKVSLLVDDRAGLGDPSALRALSVAGSAQEVLDSPERDQALARLLEAHPHLRPLAAQPECRVLKLTARRLQLLSGPSQAEAVELEQAPSA